MILTTVSARDFARDLVSPKKAAHAGPVVITGAVGSPIPTGLIHSRLYRWLAAAAFSGLK
jgi:hypothetical protein